MPAMCSLKDPCRARTPTTMLAAEPEPGRPLVLKSKVERERESREAEKAKEKNKFKKYSRIWIVDSQRWASRFLRCLVSSRSPLT